MKLKELYKCIACASLVAPVAAVAQQSPEIEEVVVTGSLVRGTPVDAALPVEVYNQSDLQLQGDPTALEFAKSLSASGPTTGEAHYFGGSGNTGNVSYNLRGIGSDKTLSLFNGRRITQNTSVIPQIALQRTEILKDGAAVTYGADATGGVVNFITRDSFEGLEVSASYKAIDGSDGDHSLGIMGGFGGDDTNVLWAAEWNHRSELDTQERDFSSLPFGVNPAPWSGLTNLAGWVPRGSLPEEPGTSANAEWGQPLGLVSDFTQESCEAVGGIYDNSFTCRYGYLPYYNLVEKNDIFRVYGQVNSAITDRMDFNLNMAYARVHTPHAYGSPSQPVVRGPARDSGLTHQLYVPTYNPFVEEFVNRTGWSANPLSGFAQGFTPITFRSFAHGGNDVFAEGDSHSTPNKNDNRYWHISTGLNGEFENGIGYDFAVTYNHTSAFSRAPDMMLARVQQALYGFGGPDCDREGLDQDPNRFGTQNPDAAGTGNCMFFNPFASNFAGQPVLGLDNPAHDPSLSNPDELIEWFFNPRESETTSYNGTVDLVFSGQSPLELPGGAVAWAAGTQWRQTENLQSVPDPLYNGTRKCIWPDTEGQVPLPTDHPDYNGCTPDEPGPFQFFGTNIPDRTDQKQLSYFGELNLPILDNLYMTAALRYEEFDEELDATVYKVSGKWDATDNLSFRGSYGTNYQAPGAGIVPGEVNNGVNSYTVAGGAWRGAQTITQSGIQPEEATVWSAGTIWDSRGLTDASTFRLIVDYFSIETEDELGLLASANEIASSVFSIPNEGPGFDFADCSHPLVDRVTFNGQCVQGETTADDFASIRTDFGNGPGQTTEGIDIQANYGLPVGPGDMDFRLTATHITKFEFSETTLDGFLLDPGADRLGFLNFATIASAVSEWRANLSANYRQDIHNVRGVINFIGGVDDDRYIDGSGNIINETGLVPAGFIPGTDQRFGPSMYGVRADNWVTADLHYTVELPWATLGASVMNLTDESPSESRQELGYDPRIGNPLERHFQLSLRRTFGGM